MFTIKYEDDPVSPRDLHNQHQLHNIEDFKSSDKELYNREKLRKLMFGSESDESEYVELVEPDEPDEPVEPDENIEYKYEQENEQLQYTKYKYEENTNNSDDELEYIFMKKKPVRLIDKPYKSLEEILNETSHRFTNTNKIIDMHNSYLSDNSDKSNTVEVASDYSDNDSNHAEPVETLEPLEPFEYIEKYTERDDNLIFNEVIY